MPSSSRPFLLVFAAAASLLVRQDPEGAAAFAPAVKYPTRSTRRYNGGGQAVLFSEKGDDNGDGSSSTSAVKEDMNPLTRASWFAVEAFGKVFGGDKEGTTAAAAEAKGDDDVDLTRSPRSLDEALARIQLDNDRSYFLSGDVDSLAYDERCTFADPFVSFDGRDRFVDNLSNLGSFITEYDAKMLNYDVSDDGATVQTRVMVKLELNLPWKPVLAWPWGVKYSIDPSTFLITSHEESWDIEPWEGVKQIFRKPTVRISNK